MMARMNSTMTKVSFTQKEMRRMRCWRLSVREELEIVLKSVFVELYLHRPNCWYSQQMKMAEMMYPAMKRKRKMSCSL